MGTRTRSSLTVHTRWPSHTHNQPVLHQRMLSYAQSHAAMRCVGVISVGSTVGLRCDTMRCANRLGRLRRLRRLHEFKFVVVYMHSQEHEDTDKFCRCTALRCAALHSTALHCTALHCTALHTRHSAVLLCFRTSHRVPGSACEPKETKHTVPQLIPVSFVCARGVSRRSLGCDAARFCARRTLPISLTTTISSGRARRAAPMGSV